jgi:RpiB/LacA/LacB family sugar-phosphate isomerase
MKIPSDAELQEIVKRVVGRIMHQGATSPTPSTTTPPEPQVAQSQPGSKTVAIGADHGGFDLKQSLVAYLKEKGYPVIDCGTHSTEAVDYPDFAQAVAIKVADGSAWRGVIIDGAGIGSCMAANKVKGVRAAMCYDHATASNSREHNNANVLTLGAGLIGPNLAKQILDTFLTTEFGGGRHARRVDKIMMIEKS